MYEVVERRADRTSGLRQRGASLCCSNLFHLCRPSSLRFLDAGKKIEWMRANPHVSVVAEEHGPGREWKSVIVDGLYEELPRQDDRDHAWSLLSRHTDWWEPGALKPVAQPLSYHSDHVFYRVIIEEVSGREARESA